MNPFQHGEVYVTEDGAETDLDIGHYERFLDVFLSQKANVTTGQIYQSVLRKERAGEYLGQCVQVIPHITDEIKSRMRAQASDDVDVIITEIGGTVGDIESQPFLEAAREVRRDLGRQLHVRARLPRAVHLRRARVEDQAHPAFGDDAASVGHLPGCAGAAFGPSAQPVHQGQDLADVRRGFGGRGQLRGRAEHLRRAEDPVRRGARRLRGARAGSAVPRRGLGRVGRSAGARAPSQA